MVTGVGFILRLWATLAIFGESMDTDAAADVDDVGAISLLHALIDRGEVQEVAGMTFCGSNPYGPPCVAALNTYYGRPDIAVGTLEQEGFLLNTTKYNKFIAETYPNPFTGPDARVVPGAVEVMRATLSRQQDQSVHFVAIGPLCNLRDLLISPPDASSPLDGRGLVAQKVAVLSAMGGAFANPEGGKEWNFAQDGEAAHVVASQWPTPMVFSGFEVGIEIETGARLVDIPNHDDPERRAYALYCEGEGKGRYSWDQTAVLYAVRGAGDLFELSEPGHVQVNASDGANRWVADPVHGRARFLRLKEGPERVAQVIEELMVAAGSSRAARPPEALSM